MSKICILIPAFNASQTVRAVAEEVLEQGFPLLVVNDGSTDDTVQKLSGLPITLLNHPQNIGKGAALKTGFAWLLENRFDAVVTLDADGQHDPAAIATVIAEADKNGYDCLIASRQSQFEEMAGLRKFWNRFGVWCMRKRTGFEITDSQSGFRFYRSSLLKGVQLEKERYDLEMELLMKGWKGGFRIGSIPVAARVADGRSTSHYRAVRDTWKICMTFLEYM